MERAFKMILSYLGTEFTGWQKTNAGTSIQEKVEEALSILLQHPAALECASRTDRGVHAQGQVARFFSSTLLSPPVLLYRINQLLPRTISVSSLEEVPLSFHPTLDATHKEYRYQICYGPIQLPFHRFTSWHFHRPLDQDKMKSAANDLLGEHDFSTFCNERALWDRSPICILEKIEILSLGDDRMCLQIHGDHFLYKMVRNLVGFLAYVGCDKIPAKETSSILASCDRTQAGITAPSWGLTLHSVSYSRTAGQ